MKRQKLTKVLLGIAAVATVIYLGLNRPNEPLGIGVYAAPSWSPNGDYLAFTFDANGTSYDNLWLFEVRSHSFRKLYDEQQVAWYSGLTWQDSDTLWFLTSIPRDSLHYIRASSNQVRDVLDTGLWHGFTFYPDQEHIVFAQEIQFLQFFRQDLFSLDINSLTVTKLTDTPTIHETAPSASPDKRYLAFRGDRNGAEVTDQNEDTYFVAQVYTDVNRYTWSPDGKWFLYEDTDSTNQPGLYLTPSDGKGTPRNILNGDVTYVSWSPDGRYIAYTTLGVPGSNELHIVSAEELSLMLPIKTEDE